MLEMLAGLGDIMKEGRLCHQQRSPRLLKGTGKAQPLEDEKSGFYEWIQVLPSARSRKRLLVQ